MEGYDFERGLKTELSQDIAEKVFKHRNRFYRLMTGRYYELIPSLIQYIDIEKTAIDQLALEFYLRQGRTMVIGLNKMGYLSIIGELNTAQDYLWYQHEQQLDITKSIKYYLPKDERQISYKTLSFVDNAQKGNCVILRNKKIGLVSDFEVIQHYVDELAEINTSRFSLTMQAKMQTFFIGDNENESINQLVSALYNGSPFVKTTSFFDPEEQIYQLNDSGLANNFVELKREYQNKLSELNNMLGVNSLAVEKSSGVSDTEAKGSQSFTSANANVYLESRQIALDLLNKRFDLELEAYYNDAVKSELTHIIDDEGERERGLPDENHDNFRGNYQA